jgi:hypothetical protein
MIRWALWVSVLGACDPPRPPPPDAQPPPDAPTLCMRGPLTMAVTTLAGCEQSGTDDGSRDAARFSNPTMVELGPADSVFVADFGNNLVRKIEADGTSTTLVKRDDFVRPFGMHYDGANTLYVETDGNDDMDLDVTTGTVWRVDLTSGAATVLTRNAGRPRGLALLADGRIAMADHVHHLLTILDPITGIVTPLAGLADTPGSVNATGTDARFAQPYDLVVNADGDLLVTELDNHKIRRVTLAGVVTDYAGSGQAGNFDGPLAVAAFDGPQAIAIASDNSLFVTDIRRHFIRKIKDGMVTTVAGDGTRGWIDSEEPRGARFYGLEGIAVDDSRIIVGDGNRGDGNTFHRIRIIDRAQL